MLNIIINSITVPYTPFIIKVDQVRSFDCKKSPAKYDKGLFNGYYIIKNRKVPE